MSRHYLINLDSIERLNIDLLPELSVPERVEFEDNKHHLIGYFLNYDGLFNSGQLLELISSNRLHELVASESEFLLFISDKERSTLNIAIDQFGRFPCFFHASDGSLSFSSSFSMIKDLLIDSGAKLTINSDGLFTAFLWACHSSDKTIFNEIKRVPAGSVIEFFPKNSNKFSIKPLVDLRAFLEKSGSRYGSIENFAEDWIKGVSMAVCDRFNVVKKLKIGSDLSSGLDCSLVSHCLSKLTDNFTCYSRYSSVIGEETIPKVVRDFAHKNNLRVKTYNFAKLHAYDSNLNKLWRKDDPFQLLSSDYHMYIDILKQDSITVQFTGDGGDEIYQSTEMDKLPLFPVQASFFENVIYLKKYGVEKIFTQKAVNYALSQKRFNERVGYPLVISPSAGAVFWFWGEVLWEHDLWFMTPFMDTRLISLARRIPEGIIGNKNAVKKQILKQIGDIFVPEMFGAKCGTENIYINFVMNQHKFINGVLRDSVFSKMGLINKERLLSMLGDDKSELYIPDIAIAFHNVIQLDWYFQKNGVR